MLFAGSDSMIFPFLEYSFMVKFIYCVGSGTPVQIVIENRISKVSSMSLVMNSDFFWLYMGYKYY